MLTDWSGFEIKKMLYIKNTTQGRPNRRFCIFSNFKKISLKNVKCLLRLIKKHLTQTNSTFRALVTLRFPHVKIGTCLQTKPSIQQQQQHKRKQKDI